MNITPLGWEMKAVLVVAGVFAVAVALNAWGLVGAALFALTALTPFILLSACVRLVVGIVDEDRRYRSSSVLRRHP